MCMFPSLLRKTLLIRVGAFLDHADQVDFIFDQRTRIGSILGVRVPSLASEVRLRYRGSLANTTTNNNNTNATTTNNNNNPSTNTETATTTTTTSTTTTMLLLLIIITCVILGLII